MLAITGRAKDELKKILSVNVENNPEAGMRLTSSGPDIFGLVIDVELPGDYVVEQNGSKVLLVEHELANRLKEYTLAFEDKKFIMAKGPLSGLNKSEVTLNIKERVK